MAFAKKNNTSNSTNTGKRGPVLNCRELHARVQNARVISEKCISFTLSFDGVSLYGMRLIDGGSGLFIAPPSTKGKDGNYYKLFGVWLSDDDTAKIIEAVQAIADTKEKVYLYDEAR